VKAVLEGNHAASYAARLCRVQVVAAYPITPQTQIVEKLAEFCADGSLPARFIQVESEHSAMAACIGAAAAGVRAFTATSSQGLALMHELLHWAAGARLPIVMVNVNRAMAPPWSIYADQTDSVAQRDTGWIQFYCADNQEVLDTVIQAYRVCEAVSLPAMLNLDAFYLSHTSEPVDLPDRAAVDAYLPPYRPRTLLDPAHPRAFGGLASPDAYMEIRYDLQQAMDEAKDALAKADAEYRLRFGRGYGLIAAGEAEGADLALVTMGTMAGTAAAALPALRQAGARVALVRVRVLRPFPAEALREALRAARRVLVLDRNLSPGSGGVLHAEAAAALATLPAPPLVLGALAGLGGRDVRPEGIVEAARWALVPERHGEERLWLGLKR
jgi:pyruvate/2-oxoacid:ferredoxin oxidoreductase alpha subunit